MTTTPSPGLVREAFFAAGERRFFLARLLYRAIFGSAWKQAVLGFAYFKCLDNLVDEDADAARALGVLAAQRRFLAEAYAADVAPDGLPPPERFGAPLFAHDRRLGAPLRAEFEHILDSMEVDTRRRGTLLGVDALDAHMVAVGGSIFRCLLYHAAPRVARPPTFVVHASRAYLFADALIDLRRDLAMGVINVPAEDVERYGLTLDVRDPTLRAWIERRAADVFADLARAGAEGRRLEHWSLRFLVKLYLSSKQRGLRRFLAREGLVAASQRL